VLINNTDANGLAVYGYESETATPAITLNDNWWGTNDSPKDLVGGNGYKPTLNRWAVLTAANASEIREGETVQLTVSINTYTDGNANGTLSKPITVKRPVTVSTNFGDIEGVLENGEFVYDLAVPTGLKYIAANVDGETVLLYVVTTDVTVAIDDVDAKKFEKVEVTVNVATDDGSEINVGNVELYIGDDLIATIPVSANKAVKEIVFTQDEGRYNLTAKYVDETNLFGSNQANATLTIAGIVELTNETFFNFFDENGLLRDEIDVDELVFHGEFSNLGVDVITIPKSLSLSGDNAVLYDMAISLEADNSKVSDIKLIADGTDFTMNRGAAILAVGENIELNNVSITYAAPRTADAYAVYAYEATGFKLIDSTIAFDSDNAGAIHHAVHISDSDDINVSGNTINASLPARDINWHWTEPYFNSIDQDTVLAIGIQGGSNGVLTENEVNVKTKSAAGMAPTIDSIIVYGVNDFEISWNNITHLDTVNAGKAAYSNAIDLYAFDGVTVKYNNVLVNSTAGKEAKGTAYPIQATGPYSGLVIEYNNLTSISNGPALGIYSQNYNGITDIVITNNNINATGNASENVNALVSGMELQDTNAKVYNNTIYSQSKGSYDDFNALYGISYSQYTEGDHTFDIKDNNIITEGKYAVYLLKAKNSNVTGNTLYAHELMGDKAVNVYSGEGNIVKDNCPVDSTLTIEVKDITVGETAVINIILESDIDGIANVIVDGKEYAVNITSGIGQVNVTDLAASDYTVSAKFISSDTNYGGGENSTVFTVAKLESDVNITISDTVLGDNATITVSIPGATGNVTVIVNGKEEEIPLDENGNATYTIDDITAGDYNVVAIYPGDKDHGFAYA
ncbi:MAG: hypothetical protein Q4Q14_05840, partial [Methanobrevibacter sp.]|nr:hypothetical protein [Methanobrevibacter sp.]